jgi:Uncharacterized protein involved in cysteine biosynthesis
MTVYNKAMNHLFDSFVHAVASLFTPAMFGVLIASLLLTILVLIGFVGGVSGSLALLLNDIPWLAFLGAAGASLIAWFLFPGIMPIIVNFFDTKIVSIIEARDYPNARGVIEAKFWPEFWHDARFTLMMLLLNIAVLPLYIIPLMFPVLFYFLNGYLLGREFFVMVARRHLPLSEANALRTQHGWLVTCAGVALTLMATLPITESVCAAMGHRG